MKVYATGEPFRLGTHCQNQDLQDWRIFRIMDLLDRTDLGLSLAVYQYTYVTKSMIVYDLQFLQYR